MSNRLDIGALYAKADEMYDRSRPGFVHAERRPASREGWVDLTFPCGLICVTNSSPIETELMYNEIFVNKEYLRSGIAIGDGDTIVDVGANVGMFTMYLLRNLKNPTIYAIEPVPETFEVLRENVRRYSHGTVHLDNTALGIHPDAETEIVLYPHMTGNSTVHPEIRRLQRETLSDLFTEDELTFIYAHKRISVSTTTLSSVIRRHAISTIDLLKIDAEGSELDILKGLEAEHWKHIKQLSIEVHDEHNTLPSLIEILGSHGMRAIIDEGTRDQFGDVVVTACRG